MRKAQLLSVPFPFDGHSRSLPNAPIGLRITLMSIPLNDLLGELKSRLAGLYGARFKGLFLYGSYARGDQQSGSDVDVLIVVDRVDHYSAEIECTSKVVSELSLKCGLSISRVFLTESDWKNRDTPFLANVRQEAIAA